MRWVNPQSWAGLGLDQRAPAMLRAGAGGEGPLPAPTSSSRPPTKSGAAKRGVENGFIVGCQSPVPPTMPQRHRSGYHGAEVQDTVRGRVMGCESLHALGARSGGRVVVGMVSPVSQRGQGERRTWIQAGGETRVMVGKGTLRRRLGLTQPLTTVTRGHRGE